MKIFCNEKIKKKLKKVTLGKLKQHRDQFFRKSKILGFRSWASFKLIELNEKFKFIKNDSNLLDLDHPQVAWSQIASKLITKGKNFSDRYLWIQLRM